MSEPQRVQVIHVSRVFGSQHGGSAYSTEMVHVLQAHGASITLMAERFEDAAGEPAETKMRRVTLRYLFRPGFMGLLSRLVDIARLWRVVLSTKRTVVIIQGDLPRLNYVFLQLLAPLIFIRQDTVLTCPANHRFLPHSRAVCLKPPGFSCLSVNQHEQCLGSLTKAHRLGRILYRLRDGFLLRRLRHFVANSQATLQRHGRNGIVLHPPNLATEPVHGARARDLHQVVFCGRLSPEKGAEDAINTLAALPSHYHLVIAGEGERQALEAHAGMLCVRERVQFLGWLSPAARDELLSSSGVLLMPSLCHEGFGMAGIEAYAQGTPVVAYEVAGIPEWCDGNAGVLVRCGDFGGAADAIVQITSDAARWNEHSEAARSLAALRFRRGRFEQEVVSLVRGATDFALH